MQVEQILQEKLISNKLHHLIVLKTNKNEAHASSELLKKTLKMIEQFFKINGNNASIENNPDVLIIKKPDSKKIFDGSIISEISRFLSHKAICKKKFVVFDDIQFLSEIQANKLLKFFEEPPIDCQYFLLNPNDTKMISTIESRCISFSIHIPESKKAISLETVLSKVKDKDLTSFCDYLKTRPDFEKQLAALIIDKLNLKASDIKTFQEYIQQMSVDKQYNDSAFMRHTLLFNALHSSL